MQVSFVVPTHRRAEALVSTLSALLALDFPADQYEVVVVDDGSGDRTAELVAAIAAQDHRIRYHEQANSGAATARNRGAELARGKLLIFLDDDMLVKPDHVKAQLAVRERHGDCLVNGEWVFSAATLGALQQTPFGRYRIALEDEIRAKFPKADIGGGRFEISAVTAADLSISARAFAELGGFNERFPHAGYEDQEFCHRARLAGHRLIYDPSIRLEHNDGRVTLEQMARRYQRGAVTAVYLAMLHPGEYGHSRLILENAPITRYDPAWLALKKTLKQILSTCGGTRLLKVLTSWIERCRPESRALPRLYSATIGLFIFRGIREGIAQLPAAAAAAREAMRAGGVDV